MSREETLMEHYDSAMELYGETLEMWSAQEFSLAKLETVVFDWKSYEHAKMMKRRMGVSTTGVALRADKKFMRQMAHLCSRLAGSWGTLSGDATPVDLRSIGPAEKIAGAQMMPLEKLNELSYICERQVRSVCTVSLQTGMVDWGFRACRILRYEAQELSRIRRTFEKD